MRRLDLCVAILSTALLMGSGCTSDRPVDVGAAAPGKTALPPTVLGPNTFSPCLDGEAAHATTNCSSCNSSDFTFDTSATTATVLGDEPESGLCKKRKQMPILFDTSSLGDPASVATLKFYVQSTTGLDVLTFRLRVYVKSRSTPCPSALDPGGFVGCGNFTDLGTITITSTGLKSFTVPDAEDNIDEDGITEFVLVDASEYEESGEREATIVIRTQNHATTSSRPTLEAI